MSNHIWIKYTRIILLFFLLIGANTKYSNQLNTANGTVIDKINSENPTESPRSNPSLHTTLLDEIEQFSPVLNATEADVFVGYNLFSLIQQERTKLQNVNRSLIVTNMEGELVTEESISFPQGAWTVHSAKFINSTTILFGVVEGAVLWNIYDAKIIHLNFIGHHDFEYNPINRTFFTFDWYTVNIDGIRYGYDIIKEYNSLGQLVWNFDTSTVVTPDQWCPYFDVLKNTPDLLHTNSLFFDADENALYFNARNLNTFYKIDHKTNQIVWGLGEYGDFTLFDKNGNKQNNLFYHAHSVEKVDENTFSLFDNDYHNQTKIDNKRSRLLEITINESSMTAYESWSWTAPAAYYSPAYGDADRLPNGNRLGVFGTQWHLFDNIEAIGTILVEINDAGQIVWELYYPNTAQYQYSTYRIERFRLAPILNSPPNIRALSTENVSVSWETFYNFRLNHRITGSYTLYLNNVQIETGIHIFDKFWRPTNLTVSLGHLQAGAYNLTLDLADEAGHITSDSLNISITAFYIEREGPELIEKGLEPTFLTWKGNTSTPLWGILTNNDTQIELFWWEGIDISIDLNSLELGIYHIALNLYDNNRLVYEENIIVTVYPMVYPDIYEFPSNQSIIWNESSYFTWEFFDYSPATWSVFVNESLVKTGIWKNPVSNVTWGVPILNMGRYNITFNVQDKMDQRTTQTTWLTVIPPSPPIITPLIPQLELQWGQLNISLLWLVHGGVNWTLWRNGTVIQSGIVTEPLIEVQIENWEDFWHPDIYNLTLQVDDFRTSSISISWIWVWVNFGDVYADSIVTGLSMWFIDGENALGPPDDLFTRLYFDYGNGHVTLDLGVDEEIRNGQGNDFTVYARGGEYAVFASNNLSIQLGVGNQVESPLIMIGEGSGNSSFDLANVGLEQIRYIQIVGLAGEDIEVDAIVAMYNNYPPRPVSDFNTWNVPIAGSIIALTVIIAFWIRRRFE